MRFFIAFLFAALLMTTPVLTEGKPRETATRFTLGGTIGDGSFGFQEPWSEVFFGTEYTIPKENDLSREIVVRLGFSPTDKEYGDAKTHRASFDFLEEIREGVFVSIGLRGSRLETEFYTKTVLRGELGLVRQLATVSRIGIKGIFPISDDDDLRGVGVSLDTPLSRTAKRWHEYTFVVKTEVVYADFESQRSRTDDTTFRVGLAIRL